MEPASAGIQAGTQVLGMLAQNYWNQQAFDQEQELMDIAQQNQIDLMGIQQGNQMALNQQGADLQYQMWKDTNYPAQVAMLREAGLNPALMYKQGGPSGTTGSQGGGSAAGGQAQKGSAPTPPRVELFGLQAKLLEAQINETNARANKIAGADTVLAMSQAANVDQDTAKKVQETSNIKTQEDLLKIEKTIRELERNRVQKGFIKGDVLGNFMNMAGLDPSNPDDQKWIKGLIYSYFGGEVVNKWMGAISKLPINWRKNHWKSGKGIQGYRGLGQDLTNKNNTGSIFNIFK